MPALQEVLLTDAKKNAVVDDCLLMIDDEVKDKGGLSGLAIKAGYAAVKNVKPGFIREVVAHLLPDFSKALDPVYQEAVASGKGISSFFSANSGKVADGLLAITDDRARRSSSGLVKGTYEKLRGSAKKNVEAAVPRLGRLIEKHGA